MALSKKKYLDSVAASRPKRMKWWTEARYGMFVHWGLYAQLERNEWVWAIENIPKEEYEKLADTFKPKPRAPREWAKLAKESGMKYMVLTTKHHEGFCLWDTKLTDFNAAKRGPKRDLVKEYVDACREFGLKIGFYYSLMDWHHPDGATCAHDEKARRRFIDYTQGLVRELMTNYGKIDILWYDVSCPLQSPEKWESVKINTMVRELQPHILINDRSQIPEDFSTPEGSVRAAEAGRGWEACMTFNHVSWGYMRAAAHDTHRSRDILQMLHTCCSGQGNLLLNIGPAPDGSVPKEAFEPLRTVGKWIAKNKEAFYGNFDRPNIGWTSACCAHTQKGKTIYAWVKHWPGAELPLAGFRTKLLRASFMDGKKIAFTQDMKQERIVLKGLPKECPDKLSTETVLIKLDFASKPKHMWCSKNAALHAWDKK
ncbi:MAG: alpha-L-fucosidase [Planctomycetaceae bacterium]|nr:alpha-L-fucosidase [Planctomycetaceae bacterium]